jgi:hypothetical protein
MNLISCGCWCVLIYRNRYGTAGRRGASADLGNAPKDRSIEVTRAAFLANTDRNVFENDEVPPMSQGFAGNTPFAHGSITMLARKIVHGSRLILSHKP